MRRRCCLLQLKTDANISRSTQLLVLRVVLRRVTGHAALGHTRILGRRLLLLEVLLVVQRRLRSHIRRGHATAGRHSTGLAGGHLGVAVLGRVDRAIVDAIRVVSRGLRRIQAGLRRVSLRRDCDQWQCAHLDEVLALGFRDERLQLRGCECVDETRLRDDEQQHLRAGEDRQFVGLRTRDELARALQEDLFVMREAGKQDARAHAC